MQVQEIGVVRLARQLGLNGRERPIEIVLLHGREPLRGSTEGLVRIQLARSSKSASALS